MESEPFVDEESDHDVCWICPALRFPAGGFDVYERPTRECPYDPADGFRYTADRVPVCVHPYDVGLPPGRYATDGLPVPAPARRRAAPAPTPTAAEAVPGPEAVRRSAPGALPRRLPFRRRKPAARYTGAVPSGLPAELDGLAAWVGQLVRGAAPEDLADVLAGAEAAALARFPEDAVLAVMRRALSGG
ncbi:hypothetical protein ACFW1A_27040 [Kitasatospora sp. NPDC058965]|uniref:hypothetical protein n=1 Tax=Kitasatospora sp. NPDC058965 TaxID=3346682 RepID=UPI0036C8E8F2